MRYGLLITVVMAAWAAMGCAKDKAASPSAFTQPNTTATAPSDMTKGGIVGDSDSEKSSPKPVSDSVVPTTGQSAVPADTTDENEIVDAVPASLPSDAAIDIPKGYEILAQTRGDLDKDGVPELVTVFNYREKGDGGTLLREIQIFRAEGEKWALWKKTQKGILNADSGGAWGDPFSSIQVARGALVIVHYGGAAERWGITHRYRFQQGAFRLIGATVEWIAALCHFNQTLDINLSTSRAVYIEEGSDCTQDEPEAESPRPRERIEFEYARRPLPTIDDDPPPAGTRVQIPGKDVVMYY